MKRKRWLTFWGIHWKLVTVMVAVVGGVWCVKVRKALGSAFFECRLPRLMMYRPDCNDNPAVVTPLA